MDITSATWRRIRFRLKTLETLWTCWLPSSYPLLPAHRPSPPSCATEYFSTVRAFNRLLLYTVRRINSHLWLKNSRLSHKYKLNVFFLGLNAAYVQLASLCIENLLRYKPYNIVCGTVISNRYLSALTVVVKYFWKEKSWSELAFVFKWCF